MKIYVIYYNKKKCGPFSYDELKKLLEAGKINLKIFAWKKGMKNWTHLGDMEEFSTRKKIKAPEIENELISNETDQNKKWFVYDNEKKIGPLSKDEIETLLKEKKIRRTSFAYKQGMSKWTKLTDLLDFEDFFKKMVPEEKISEETLEEKNINLSLKTME